MWSSELRFPVIENPAGSSNFSFIAPFHADFDCRKKNELSTHNSVHFRLENYENQRMVLTDHLIIQKETVFTGFVPHWYLKAVWYRVQPRRTMREMFSSTFTCELTCNNHTTQCFVMLYYSDISEEAFSGKAPHVIFLRGQNPGSFLFINHLLLSNVTKSSCAFCAIIKTTSE